jgi:membrane protein YdbS with pleckstrin-like domain
MNAPRSNRRHWIVVFALLVLLVGHGTILYFVSAHTALSASVISGAIVILVLKHLGLFAPLYALVRRRFRRE